jgi:uncharacterized protein YdhG (YjbR/CyaY superfamily)
MAGMKKSATVEAYLAAVPAKDRAILEKIRAAVKSVVPDAEEKISYGMPAFTYHGNLLYYAAMKNHLSLFPGSKSVVKKFAAELKPFDAKEGTIRFTVEKPLPLVLVKKIARMRAAENRTRIAAKSAGRAGR